MYHSAKLPVQWTGVYFLVIDKHTEWLHNYNAKLSNNKLTHTELIYIQKCYFKNLITCQSIRRMAKMNGTSCASIAMMEWGES